MVREVERTGAPVYLTVAHLEADYVRRRFPTIAAACRQAGLDLARVDALADDQKRSVLHVWLLKIDRRRGRQWSSG